MNALLLDLDANYHKARAKNRHPVLWWLTSKMTSSRGIDADCMPTAGAHSNYRHVGTVVAQKWFGYHLYTQSLKGHHMYHDSATPPLACTGDTCSPTSRLYMVSRIVVDRSCRICIQIRRTVGL